MTTHQSITGGTDGELLSRMVHSYAGRFNDAYWTFFDQHVRPRLTASPTLVDLGCGPGLFVQDLNRRVPGAKLFGFDLTPAMVDHARSLDWGGSKPTLGELNLLTDNIPLADASADMVSITAVMHLFDDPFPVLGEIKRVLKPSGTFVLYDWVRTSLAEYLARDSSGGSSDDAAGLRRRQLKLFAAHNHYAAEDWRWIVNEAGFDLIGETRPSNKYHRLFAAAPRPRA